MSEKSKFPMTAVAEAIAKVVEEAGRLPTRWEEISITTAHGRVLATDVIAKAPFPPFRAAVLDGFAVDADALKSTAADTPAIQPFILDVIGEPITAGVDPSTLISGNSTCAYVTTGAKMPAGATAVIGVENVEVLNISVTDDASSKKGPAKKKIRLKSVLPAAGDSVRGIGKDIVAGTVVLRAGTKLGAADLGILVTLGQTNVTVVCKVVVGVISTGNELVDFPSDDISAVQDVKPGSGQIRDVNRTVLLTLLGSLGAQTIDLGLIKDDLTLLKSAISNAITPKNDRPSRPACDIIVTSGGVSMGSADFVKPLLEQSILGEETMIHFGRLNMKPGKPTTFATITDSSKRTFLFFGLPGNPVSSYVTARLLIEPAMKRMTGLQPALCLHPQIDAITREKIKMDPERPEYHRVMVSWVPPKKDGNFSALSSFGYFMAASTGVQMSSRLLSVVGANALLCVPQGEGVIPAGTQLPALILGSSPVFPPPLPADSFHRTCAELPAVGFNPLHTIACDAECETFKLQKPKPKLSEMLPSKNNVMPVRLCLLSVALSGTKGAESVEQVSAASSAMLGHFYTNASTHGLVPHLLESRVVACPKLLKTSTVEVSSSMIVRDIISSWLKNDLHEAQPDLVIVVGGCGVGPSGFVPEMLVGLTDSKDSETHLASPLAEKLLVTAARAAQQANFLATQRTFIGRCHSHSDNMRISSKGVFTVAIPGPPVAAISALEELMPLLRQLLHTQELPR